MSDKKIDVAVVGGGMGGLCVAIGLLKLPHLNVQVYEGAHKFSEIGAGVAFGPNAQRALKLIGKECEDAYLRQVTHNGWPEFKNTWFEYRYGMGPHEGEFLAAPKNETGQSTVHRAKFLDEFVALVPKEIAHFAKRLDEIDDSGEKVKLHFQDGTTVEADCVICADGVHSVGRKHLLGADHPAVNAVFTGSVAYRGLIPMKEAIEAVGARYAQNSFVWVGDGANVMTYPVDFGETFNIVASNSSYQNWEGPWVQHVEFDRIAPEFAKWGEHVQKILKLLDRPATAAWSLWDHPPAPTYCGGRVVIMGDAAHASTPFQGQGAGQAIEDAFVLSSLFAHIDTPDKIPLAFKAYDRIRRPRSQQVCKTSREMGEMVAMRLPNVMHDPEAFKENIMWRMDWMWHRDVALERDQAIGVFEKLVRGEPLD